MLAERGPPSLQYDATGFSYELRLRGSGGLDISVDC